MDPMYPHAEEITPSERERAEHFAAVYMDLEKIQHEVRYNPRSTELECYNAGEALASVKAVSRIFYGMLLDVATALPGGENWAAETLAIIEEQRTTDETE